MTGRLVARQDLTPGDIDAMRQLLSTYFEGVTPEQFAADLAAKNWAVLIEDGKTLVGFSTLLVEEVGLHGETISVVYSGDTIVSPAAWGSAVFPRAWITSVYALRRHYPRGRLLWLLLTSGFRTYRLLPVFWQSFYPHHDRPTPDNWQSMIDALAGRLFGDRYDAAAGVVRLAHPQSLRNQLAAVPVNRQSDPHVRFFLDRNPGHLAGDELVCIADLDAANLSAAGRRVVFGPRR